MSYLPSLASCRIPVATLIVSGQRVKPAKLLHRTPFYPQGSTPPPLVVPMASIVSIDLSDGITWMRQRGVPEMAALAAVDRIFDELDSVAESFKLFRLPSAKGIHMTGKFGMHFFETMLRFFARMCDTRRSGREDDRHAAHTVQF